MKRPFIKRKGSEELNRKQRKARWINRKNLMTAYPECAYGGDFYCNHEYDPKNPWCWVDFTFFHTKLKRYFAVAMTTLEYDAWHLNEEAVQARLDVSHPYTDTGMVFGPIDKKTGTGAIEFTSEWKTTYNIRKPLLDQQLAGLNEVPVKARPTIKVKDYGSVAVGVWASVDEPFIDEHVIRKFIAQYRDLGEPMEPGIAHVGEEVEVVPAKLGKRYAS